MDYIYIRAWGRLMGSENYFIRAQLETAHEDKAPGNAIYKGEDGIWVTIEAVKSGNRRQQVERLAAEIQRTENPQHPVLPNKGIMQ
jgi:hypothetical protein